MVGDFRKNQLAPLGVSCPGNDPMNAPMFAPTTTESWFIPFLVDGNGVQFVSIVLQSGTGVLNQGVNLGGAQPNTDGVLTTVGALYTEAFGYGFNGATFDRLRAFGDNSDAV